jgi:DnaA-homolog protein
LNILVTEPQQLPLPIRLRAASVFATYFEGDNAATVQMLKQAHRPAASPLIFLYGVSGSGKTHLLQALCAAAGQRGEQATYAPLKELSALGPEVLSGCEQSALVCVDDVQLVASGMDWNRTLFALYRDCEERHARLVLTCDSPPAGAGFALRDLSSRVLAGTVLRLQMLNDDQQIEALKMHATQRGFELPDDVAQFLLKRLPRDMHSLCGFIDELDVALLAAQRRLSVPFVRGLLQEK